MAIRLMRMTLIECSDVVMHMKSYHSRLDPVMERNRFFHPLYLMRYGNLRPECYEAMMRFREIVRL